MTLAYFSGLDLGQTSDFTALAVLERAIVAAPPGPPHATYAVRHLQRWKLGTKYTAIAGEVVAMLHHPPLPGSVLAVDQTGVGRPVVDTLRDLRPPVKVLPVTITTGSGVTCADDGGVHVPKKELVSVLQVLLQAGRLKVANTLPDAALLVRELQSFKVKITAAGNETFEAWRERDHDDLVLAVALAAWAGEYHPPPYTGPLMCWPPMPGEYDGVPSAGQSHGGAAATAAPAPAPPQTEWERLGLPGSVRGGPDGRRGGGESRPDPYGDEVREILRRAEEADDRADSGMFWEQ